MTPPLHITGHAIQRYQERVENIPDDQVRAKLSTKAFTAAAAMGCTTVRLASGHRVKIKSGSIVTVLPTKPVLVEAFNLMQGDLGREGRTERFGGREAH